MREVSACSGAAAFLRAVFESLLTCVATEPTRGAVAIVKQSVVAPFCLRRNDRAFAFAVTPAVVCRARVRPFAALCAIVGKASRAITTRNASPRDRAFAFAVTPAVVCRARVHPFFAALRPIVGIASWAIATRNAAACGWYRARTYSGGRTFLLHNKYVGPHRRVLFGIPGLDGEPDISRLAFAAAVEQVFRSSLFAFISAAAYSFKVLAVQTGFDRVRLHVLAWIVLSVLDYSAGDRQHLAHVDLHPLSRFHRA